MATIEMGARPYVLGLGRFLQVDPVEGGSANDYEYGDGDPVNNFSTATASSENGTEGWRLQGWCPSCSEWIQCCKTAARGRIGWGCSSVGAWQTPRVGLLASRLAAVLSVGPLGLVALRCRRRVFVAFHTRSEWGSKTRELRVGSDEGLVAFLGSVPVANARFGVRRDHSETLLTAFRRFDYRIEDEATAT